MQILLRFSSRIQSNNKNACRFAAKKLYTQFGGRIMDTQNLAGLDSDI